MCESENTVDATVAALERVFVAESTWVVTKSTRAYYFLESALVVATLRRLVRDTAAEEARLPAPLRIETFEVLDEEDRGCGVGGRALEGLVELLRGWGGVRQLIVYPTGAEGFFVKHGFVETTPGCFVRDI